MTEDCDEAPPVPDDVAEAKLKQIIGEAIGQASMCWKPYPTGNFDSTRAAEICDGVIGLIRAASTPSAEVQALRDKVERYEERDLDVWVKLHDELFDQVKALREALEDLKHHTDCTELQNKIIDEALNGSAG